MKELIQVELYKMKKKKFFLWIYIFNSISLLYAIGILLNWSWISFHGKFDLIQYIGAIWQLLFLTGLPLIFFMYIGASILGGEKAEGQILLEITRVADRKKLVKTKMLAMVIIVLYYFVTNFLISALSYLLLVRKTEYITAEWVIFNKSNIELIIVCSFGCIYILISVFASMYISIRYGAVIATIVGTALYAAMLLIVRIPQINLCVPGYFALTVEADMGMRNIGQQILLCGMSVWGLWYLTKMEICKIDL